MGLVFALMKPVKTLSSLVRIDEDLLFDLWRGILSHHLEALLGVGQADKER
jgi:hypothetical protein